MDCEEAIEHYELTPTNCLDVTEYTVQTAVYEEEHNKANNEKFHNVQGVFITPIYV